MRLPPATVLVLFAALHTAHAQMPEDTAPPPSTRFPAAWYPPPNDNATTAAAVKGRPYIADVTTTGRYRNPRTGEMKSQTTTTLQARDSAGRVREEVESQRPDGKGNNVPVRNITVHDPVSHCTFSWMQPWVVLPQYDHGPVASVTCDARIAHLQDFDVFQHIADEPEGTITRGNMTYKTKRLHPEPLEGMDVVGTRRSTTHTMPDGTVQSLITDWLYAPDLQALVALRTINPDGTPGATVAAPDTELSNIRRVEPDPRLFYPPQGYRIESTRAKPAH